MAAWQEYSREELQQINEASWRSPGNWLYEKSRLPCPTCRALAEVVFVDANFGSPAEIHVQCHSCKTIGTVAAVEEMQGKFPEEQVTEYVKRHQMGLSSRCSFCHTPLTIDEHGNFEGMTYVILCLRCGGSGTAER
ncbi:MAG TPA: hypothetical protein VGC93_00265 [Thermoanaerobaculia bacterium]